MQNNRARQQGRREGRQGGQGSAEGETEKAKGRKLGEKVFGRARKVKLQHPKSVVLFWGVHI